jgi:AcrR family transcriptional regulator
MNESLRAAFRQDDPVAAIRDCVARYIEFGRANQWLYGVLFVSGEVDYTALDDTERAAIAFPQQQVRECFDRAKRAGALRGDVDIDTAPFLLWAAAHGLTCLMISGRISADHPGFPVVDERQFIDNFVDLAVRGFVPA